jgi:transposase
VLADSAYTGEVVALAASASRVEVEIGKRTDDRPGFVPIPKRWVVERSFGWFNFDRVLAKNYEHTTVSAEGWVKLAGIDHHVQGKRARPSDPARVGSFGCARDGRRR